MAVRIETSFTTRDGRSVPTFMARPDGEGPYPGILMGYEFYGMLEVPGGASHMRSVANRFADAGFCAIVPDYYASRGKQPTMSGGMISGGPSDDETRDDLVEAAAWLQGLQWVKGRKVGAIGWCGGGRQVLLLAAQTPGLRAVASFYGRLQSRPGTTAPSPIEKADQFTCPVFGAYGEDDHSIPVATARDFDTALRAHGVPHEIHLYKGAGHAFMNDERDSYVAAAAADAWSKVIGFFDRNLSA
ncbi:MAG: putative carboxymethylenebutenolidase [Rhizobium sp.]|nr:putative carboxymethylenebutenolidase [Rhizobium sp.]